MLDTVALVAKSVMGVLLVVAGASKLADLTSFAAAIRLFLPHQIALRELRLVGATIALSEFAIGAASLSRPTTGWLNGLVLALSCGFLVISTLGYVFHRGRSCRCFGALSKRRFDALGIVRSLALVAISLISTRPVSAAVVDVNFTESFLLALVGVLVGLGAFTAAQSLSLGIRYGLVKR